MAYALPHTDSEVEALVQRLINEDKGRRDVLLNLAFQFEDSGAVRDDLRKAYKKCNDISRESHALICTLLKESSKKDPKVHLSIYGKVAQLEKQMETKSAWFQEKYSGRTHRGIGCSSSQADFPLTEKELHQLRMDEEALKEMLEEEAMNKKAQEEKIRQEQAENDAFFLEFGVASSFKLETFALNSSVLFVARVKKRTKLLAWKFSGKGVVGTETRSLGGLEFFEFVHDPQRVCPRYQLPLSAILRSHSRQLSSSLAVTSSGLSSDVSDAGLPSEKIMASGKNGDDGDLLLFRDGPAPVQVIGLLERLASQVFLEWDVPWWLPVSGSCQEYWILALVHIRRVHISLDSGAGVNLYVLNFFP
ncbi:hypothetical protein Tco_0771913 [Tanacetum coccineum]|uniref:Uncharacterized protein n=1 Tax=Tanacetum coccineum TaxID=301880 RepID=A0ABQ4ZK18_9ASTR